MLEGTGKTMPQAQVTAFSKGLIPYIPADKDINE